MVLKEGPAAASVASREKKKGYMVNEVVQKATETAVLISLVIYTQNEERNVDCLKFRIDLVEGLLVKYSAAWCVRSP
jgi:hypothetical protein